MNQRLYCNIVDSVFDIISSQSPTHLASRYIDDKVLIRIDDISIQGFNYWCMWVEYMRHFGRLLNLTLIRKETVIDGNCAKIRGIARGNLEDNKIVENEILVTFCFNEGKIVEINTSRFNYTATFGNKIKYKLIFYLLVLHMIIWDKIFRRKEN